MRPRPSNLIAASLLLLMFLLAGGAALRESVAIDEVAHIGAGLSYLHKFDLRLNEEHPPLAKLLAALPLALRGTRADYTSIQWTVATKFFPAYLSEWTFGEWVLSRWNNPTTVLIWARLPMLLLSLLLGWVIFVFARRLGGPWGGLLSLASYTTMPVFLAFGPLVLTDVAITLFAILTLWSTGELWLNPNLRNTRWFALALAGALLSKFSSGILIIAILVFVLTTRRWPLARQPADKIAARSWRKLRWRALRQGTLFAALLLYAVYFVFSWNQPMDIPGLASHGFPLALVGRLLMPPWLFLRGLGWVLLTATRPSFLLGRAYPHGVWFYFPVLLLLKSPLSWLGLLLLTPVLAWWRKRQSPAEPIVPSELAPHWRALWVTLLVFTAICLVGTMDISIRHFSVPLVLLILLTGPLPRLIERSTPRLAWAAGFAAIAMAASGIITAVRQYPYYFPYVSPLGLGQPLYWLMSDSNVDWNQALPEVKQFAAEHHLSDVPLDNYGFSDPAVFVPHARLWDCQTPSAADAGQWVFLSANMILDSHNCGWIMQYPHVPLAAGGMYAVRLPSPIPPAGSSAGPPPPSARRTFLNAPIEMRSMFHELTDHPERTQQFLDQMMAAFSKSQAAAKQKPKLD